MAVEFQLPELGENIETVDVSSVLVAVGDVVRADDPVIEVLTARTAHGVPGSRGATARSSPLRSSRLGYCRRSLRRRSARMASSLLG